MANSKAEAKNKLCAIVFYIYLFLLLLLSFALIAGAGDVVLQGLVGCFFGVAPVCRRKEHHRGQ